MALDVSEAGEVKSDNKYDTPYWPDVLPTTFGAPTGKFYPKTLSDQEIRARALECAAALAAPSATWHSRDVLKLACEFEAYIKDGR